MDQWFYEASGLSATALSFSIRAIIFIITVVWASYILRGMINEIHEETLIYNWYSKLCLVAVLVVTLWTIVY